MVPSDENDCTIGSLVEIDEVDWVEVKRRLRNVQGTCRAMKHIVPGSIL